MLAMFLSAGLMAQTASFNQTASNPTGLVVNAGADTMNLTLTHAWNFCSIQPLFVKNTGTAAGTATLYYSVNGVDYITTGSTLSITDVARNSTVWTINKPAQYLRIIVTGGTTMNLTCSAKFAQGQ